MTLLICCLEKKRYFVKLSKGVWQRLTLSWVNFSKFVLQLFVRIKVFVHPFFVPHLLEMDSQSKKGYETTWRKFLCGEKQHIFFEFRFFKWQSESGRYCSVQKIWLLFCLETSELALFSHIIIIFILFWSFLYEVPNLVFEIPKQKIQMTILACPTKMR